MVRPIVRGKRFSGWRSGTFECLAEFAFAQFRQGGCNRSPSPGQLVVSYETYALVRDIVVAEARPPITMKGISREVVPYAITGMIDADGETVQVFSEHLTGLDFYLNANMIDASSASHIRKVLQDALKAMRKRSRNIRSGSSGK